ncbi:hypothetical protein NQ176_g5208 [Zarea fungicola]|uniref:Uncharacterized protein n=1 Tax=Zarea fungicola TaxID=93591 RepID=A0ACC1NB18_9HYPO|nr:hypothetical protein NQ176_g5208 [Lecanicillium fungicola]
MDSVDNEHPVRANESVAERYERLAEEYDISVDCFPLNKSQILHLLRGTLEVFHREEVYQYSAVWNWLCEYAHKPVDFNSVSGLTLQHADDCCGRTAPIFVLRDDLYHKEPLPNLPGIKYNRILSADTSYRQVHAFLCHMQNYIYKRWLRPFKTEIDCRRQFLTKTNLPPRRLLPQATCPPAMVDLVQRMSVNLVARVRHTKSLKISREEEEADKVFYYVTPLFEAIAVSVRVANFDYRAPDVATMPVLLVRTGIEKDLTAPITFDAIPAQDRINECMGDDGVLVAVETRLERAVTFLIDLELREGEAFRPPLDPARIPQDRSTIFMDWDVGSAAEDLGWDAATMGPLRGPSSSWGDPDSYPNWPPDDRRQRSDARYARLEKQAIKVAQIEVDLHGAESSVIFARSQGE